jgi:hypothetical protein
VPALPARPLKRRPRNRFIAAIPGKAQGYVGDGI